MSNTRPTEPPPIQMPLAITGEIKGCIIYVSVLMAICLPSMFSFVFSSERAMGQGPHSVRRPPHMRSSLMGLMCRLRRRVLGVLFATSFWRDRGEKGNAGAA